MKEYKFTAWDLRYKNFTREPWPSTYVPLGDVNPRQLKSHYEKRAVGATRVAIPPRTIEPPQIHLDAPRDGKPFEELLTDFNLPFQVAILNAKTEKKIIREYDRGENIIIPKHVIHWLINPNSERLDFTCEYAPFPWDGVNDEPEYPTLSALLADMDKRGLMQKVFDASPKEDSE